MGRFVMAYDVVRGTLAFSNNLIKVTGSVFVFARFITSIHVTLQPFPLPAAYFQLQKAWVGGVSAVPIS